MPLLIPIESYNLIVLKFIFDLLCIGSYIPVSPIYMSGISFCTTSSSSIRNRSILLKFKLFDEIWVSNDHSLIHTCVFTFILYQRMQSLNHHICIYIIAFPTICKYLGFTLLFLALWCICSYGWTSCWFEIKHCWTSHC